MLNFATINLAVSILATFMAVYLLIMSLTRREEGLDQKLKKFTAQRSPVFAANTPKQGPKQLLTSLAHFAPHGLSQGLDRELVRAGVPLKGGEFLVVQTLVAILLFMFRFVLVRNPVVGLGFAVLGFFLPRLWLNSMQTKRRRTFNNQLADALMILANSLRAGFSLFQAMDMVSQEMSNPLAGELRITLREMTYGTPTEDALQRLTERVGSKDLDLMVTAIMIQRSVGGNLAEVLTNIHGTIQERIRIQQEIKTLTAQGRMSGYMIAALPFGIAGILLVINPSYIKVLVSDSLGWKLLGGGLVSQFIGFMIIRKIITVKV